MILCWCFLRWSPNQAFHMVERLALFHLTDFLCWPFESAFTPLLEVLYYLLEMLDSPVADALREAEMTACHFAVPWVITWFAHNLPRLHQQVMRLFDCLLAGHSSVILYFAAALVERHREALLELPREMIFFHQFLQRLPLDELDVDVWACEVRGLLRRVPPAELLSRLPRDLSGRLPSTSPLLHFPHPWMQRMPVAKPTRRFRLFRSSRGDSSEKQDSVDLRSAAPVYDEVLMRGRKVRSTPLTVTAILRAFSVGGAVIMAWGLSSLSSSGVL